MNIENDYSSLINVVQQHVNPTAEEWKMALPLLKKEVYSKNHELIKAGEQNDCLYFIISGITRHYFSDKVKGDSGTVWFSYPGDWVNDAYGFPTQQPALTSIITVTEVEALCIKREDRETLFASSPVWERLGRLGAEGYLIKQMLHTWSLYFRTAKERFDILMQEHPELFQQTPLIHIASFLGITPETLSRLRGVQSKL